MVERPMPTNAVECPKCHNMTMRDTHCGVSLRGEAKAVAVPVVAERARAKPRMPKQTEAELRWLREVAPTHFPVHAIVSQGLTLPLQDGGTYRADHLAIPITGRQTIIEVKGGYKGPGAEQGIERYRRARYQWEKYYNFEMWETLGKGKKWEVER